MNTAAFTTCSSLEHRLAGDEGWRAPPARQLGRSQSAVRGSSFAEHGSASASNSRPSAAVTNAYTASSSRSSSNAAPLQSFFSLPPTRTLRSSTAAGSQPQPYSQPVVANSVLQNGPSQAPRLHAAPSTSRLDQLYAAYKEPAGRLSNSRSASVGRRSSGDIAAASLRSVDSGIGSLRARPQPVRTARAVSVDRRPSSVSMKAGSSRTHGSDLRQEQSRYAQQQSGIQAVDRSLSRRAYPDSSSSSSISGRSSLLDRSNCSSSYDGADTAAKAQGAPQVKASSGLPSSIDPQAKATSGRQTLSRQTSSVGSSNYQTSYQSAYSVPSASFKSLSVKHDAHGDRLLPAGQQDLIQAVPSGSGRLSLGALQDQQHSFAVSHCAHPSGKALITAALSKMGFTMRSGKGFVGLVNLGNTCFANSIMQCLVAIPELVAFFLTATAEAGHQQPTGPVSRAFGGLIQQLWQSYSTAVDPYDFMRACGSHEKQWKDGRQHDAQEYLRSILEAMQTELNRVRGRPAYKELKGEGTVSQQADEAWEYAHSRSNSVIQDVFAGQLQSTLECPACHALSHTFDEFMDLSLPLPQKS
ncbi:MAG: ubiquitin carboxyl-terminal hydrolase 8-like [Trebouxia sp. A1-2]|nr:MAG: ubiquitin carboxyl-terminal hydrolase 8-like [Trebouxia sp. A1-2]